jgi:AcrR family transcriptional regulator
MPQEVKRNDDRRAARVAQTELRILDAARDLFLERGYLATTLADVAERADVAARTVYVRFGTKAAVFKRVVDVALVGDTAPVDLAHRPGAVQSMSAATLDERIRAFVGVSAGVIERTGELFTVAVEAEAAEPELARAAQAGREATRRHAMAFWRQARADRLIDPALDVTWLGETTEVLIAADTWVHIRKTKSWSPRRYTRWLNTTLRHLADLETGAE